MTPAQTLVLVDSLLSGVEILLPRVAELTKSGEITTDDQNALLGRIAAIRNGTAFSGDEWKTDEQG